MSAWHRWSLSLAFLIPFGVYWVTRSEVWALDTIYSIDSAELVIAAYTLGVDHPPGHPLYLLVARLFTLLPFDLPDAGLAFSSVIFGALAALFLALATYERTEDSIASLGTALTFAFGFIFWIHATIVEVYAFQLAFLSLFLYLAARWLNKREERTLLLLFFALALGSTANILLLPLMTPAVLLVLWGTGVLGRCGSWLLWSKLIAVGIIGVTPMLYIPFRLTWGDGFVSDFVDLAGFELQSPRWYLWYLTAEVFTGKKITDTPISQFPFHFFAYLRAYAGNLSLATSIMVASSILLFLWAIAKELISNLRQERGQTKRTRRGRRKKVTPETADGSEAGFLRRRKGLLFDATQFVCFVCTMLPVVSFSVPDREVFFMPSFFFLTAFLGPLLHRINDSIGGRLPGESRPLFGVVVCFSIPIYLLVRHQSSVTHITGDNTHYQQRLIGFQRLPPNSTIVGGDDGKATRYKYFQIVSKLRPDIAIQTLGRLAPHFRGPVDLKIKVIGDVGLAFNTADRLRVVKRLLRENPDRPLFVVLDYRMPPEFDHFRVTRSAAEPNLLRIQPKPLPEMSASPAVVDVRTNEQLFAEIRFEGFEIGPLDQGFSETHISPISVEGDSVNGIVKRDELFEVGYAIQRTSPDSSKFFAEFAFINDALSIPSKHDFVAAKQIEILADGLPNGWYLKDRFVFKIPGFIPKGIYTLAVKVNKASRETQGSYQGKPVFTLMLQPTLKPWMGQSVYRPLGRLFVD